MIVPFYQDVPEIPPDDIVIHDVPHGLEDPEGLPVVLLSLVVLSPLVELVPGEDGTGHGHVVPEPVEEHHVSHEEEEGPENGVGLIKKLYSGLIHETDIFMEGDKEQNDESRDPDPEIAAPFPEEQDTHGGEHTSNDQENGVDGIKGQQGEIRSHHIHDLMSRDKDKDDGTDEEDQETVGLEFRHGPGGDDEEEEPEIRNDPCGKREDPTIIVPVDE